MSQNALINRSLTTIHNELDFLVESGVISEKAREIINEQVPRKYSQPVQDAPPTPNVATKTAAPEYSSEEIVRAVYDYNSQDPSDLTIRRGEEIIVLEKVNADWWRGKSRNSNAVGIFPSNYVEPVTGGSQSEKATNYSEKADYRSESVNSNQNYNNGYASPAPPTYNNGYQAPMPYYAAPAPAAYQPPFPPPSTNYYPQQQQLQPQPQQQVQPQVQPVVVQQPAQQGSSGHSELGKIGRKFGDAAIFGAGATIGSNIVNSIF